MDNQIIQGDCLTALRGLPAGCADLVYMDPPFNTGRQHEQRNGSFDDRFRSAGAYLEWLRPRIEESLRVLRHNGSILVHCDWRMCHHLRLLLDELLDPQRLVNHLVWRYGLGGSSPRAFARKHDDILYYAKSDGYWFEAPKVPATSARMQGRQKKATDVIDIPSINNMARERCGYPTQKPVALLEVLIRACCPPGGLVIDPFCGSGTTCIAALRHGRRFVGIDLNRDAVMIAGQRLATERAPGLGAVRR
jgi:DNA modification methylase